MRVAWPRRGGSCYSDGNLVPTRYKCRSVLGIFAERALERPVPSVMFGQATRGCRLPSREPRARALRPETVYATRHETDQTAQAMQAGFSDRVWTLGDFVRRSN